MARVAALTPETARAAAPALLGELVARHGQVGPMVSIMANFPAVLGGYLQLSRALKRAKLDRAISERISLAVQEQRELSAVRGVAALTRAPGPLIGVRFVPHRGIEFSGIVGRWIGSPRQDERRRCASTLEVRR